MKLWQKDYDVNQRIEQFTVGKDRELDLFLAKYDILGSLAHIHMLESIDLLTTDELKQLTAALRQILGEVEAGRFEIQEGVEDVHSQVELLLTQKLGDIGKKIHSGRSRNDQVLVDLRLFFRQELQEVAEALQELFDTLLDLSETHKNALMPGYTHLQVAMVSSFGLWFGAYAESLADDLQLLESVYHINNQNPLGSAAGYGSSFPLNRRMTTELLGFSDLNYNVIHAQMGRGKTELFISFALAAIGSTLAKLAMDVTLFINQNFGFISFPDELTTGSSIMPHKKNPDVFELLRAKSNKLQALPQEIMLITSNLPAGYHRDFQLLKENLFPALRDVQDCLSIASFALQQIEIKPEILNDKKYKYLYTVEVVNQEVLSGLPFREAYQKIGQAVENGTFHFDGEIEHTHEGSLGNLCTADIRAKWQRIWQRLPFEQVEKSLKALAQK